jgi:hypothetical protein
MKTRLILFLSCTLFLAGCSATARLYPIRGPLSSQTPTPVYLAKFSGAFRSGTLTATLDGGEICTGRWQMVPRPKLEKGATNATDPAAGNMTAEWDLVYGHGFYVAQVLGQRLYVRSTLTGNRGTVLTAEMYRPDTQHAALGSIKGVAKDDKNNIYKIAF